MLPEDRRTQLDSIVQQMTANRESDADIQAVVNDFKQKYTATQAPQKPSVLERAANITDSIFGGGKVGEAIGTQLAKRMVSPEAAQYVSPSPSAREIAGSALQSASLFIPVGRIAGVGAQASRALGLSRIAKTVGNVGAGALGGYGFDVATNLQDTSKQGAEVLKPGLGTAIGGAIPGTGAVASGVKNAVVTLGEKQAPRVINSLIKPLLKDFSYGKNPGRVVAEEGIVANTFEELEKGIRTRRQEIGQSIGDLGNRISTKSEIQLGDSLNVLTDAMKEAASLNNPTLLARLQQVKKAITENLAPAVDEQGNIVIQSLGSRKLNSLSFPEARDILRDIGDMTQFTGNPSDDKAVNMALKKLYGSIKQKTLDFARKESPELADEFETLTEKYADLSSAEIATKYRDKILERQSLVGMSPQMAGIASGIVTLVATGGAALPAVLVGIGGAALDKLLASPAFKTRLASLLAKKSGQEVNAIFSKFPALEKYFPKGSAISPGDRVLELGEEALDGVDLKNIPMGLSMENVAKNIHPEDKTIMTKFIDSVRLGSKLTDNDYNMATKLMEKFGISQDKSLSSIANEFDKILSGQKKVVGTAVPGSVKKKLGNTTVPKADSLSSPLLQEAKKYKTAEEFVNNTGSIRDNYDWSYLDEMRARKKAGESYSHSDLAYLSKIEASKRGKESRTFYRAGVVGKDGDVWLTPQEAGATQYGSAGGTKVGEYKVATQNPLILQDVKSIEKILGKKLASESNFTNSPSQKQAVIDYAKKNGYDSVLMPDSFPDGAPGMESLVVWDKNLIKTRSQLLDLWKKANNK